jgi:5'-AMP-activated protein kinase regulatory gamma subunit
MLSNTTAGNLVADKTHTFIARSTDSIESVLGKLYVHDILSLPVIDEKGQLAGVVSVLDLLIFLAWGPYFDTGELNAENVTQLKNLDRPISHLLGLTIESRKLWIVEPTISLAGLMEPFSRGLHRVLVPQKDDEGKHHYRVLSQSDVAAFIYKYRHEVAETFSKTLSELGIKPKPVTTITADTSALEGFRTMTVEKVPAVAIVENSVLIGNLSASDLRGLTARRLRKVVAPVKEFLAIQYGTMRDPLTTTLNSTLDQAMQVIGNDRVHRLWIVDEKKAPIGVFSLTDVLKLFTHTKIN